MSTGEIKSGQMDITESVEAGAAGDQYLTFFCDNEEYGVDILRVQEIRGWSKATAIPNTPEYMRGVINIRGTIVPIIDLRMRLNLEVADYDRTTVVIVLRIEVGGRDRIVGIVVDGVSDVYNLLDSQMKPAPELAISGDVQFAKNIATVNDKMIIILDVDQLYEDGDSDDSEDALGSA